MSKRETGTPKARKFPLRWIVLSAISVVLAIVFAVAWVITSSYTDVINKAFNLSSTKSIFVDEADKEKVYFKSEYDSMEQLKEADMKIAEQLTEEGAVLLKNDNNALPLRNNAKVTLLGHSSPNMLVCGTGSADIKAEGAPTLKEAIEKRTDMKVNPTVWNYYADLVKKELYLTNPKKGDNSIRGGDGSVQGSYTVNEVPWSEVTKQNGVTDSFNEYSDAAIMVVARLGGEMYDIPATVASKGNKDETVGGSGNSLELTIQEKEVIKEAKKKFGKVIVLVNSANPVECDFLTAENSDVDAALWIGYTGLVGLYGVADLLVGNENPSGRLVDTYCNDNTTNPAMVNFYANLWSNYQSWGKDMTGSSTGGDLDGNQSFNAYQEGIYVGYRYYETRYEDAVLNRGNTSGYNYLADVAYPFGYGLSYTTFGYSTPEYTDNGSSITVKLTVTNTGEYAGKDVVEVYFQSEYTDYDKEKDIEKAAIELCGFAKTKVLEKGESEEVEITVDKKEFRTYDRKGYGTYIMDAGQYYLTVGTDAHDALNNVLAKKGATGMVVAGDKATVAGDAEKVYGWTVANIDAETYSVSNGNKVENRFDSAELSYYGGTDMEYVSRSDWQGTFPTAKVEIELTQAMMNELTGYKDYNKSEYTTEGETLPEGWSIDGSESKPYALEDMIGLEYDDPKWETLLNQVSYAEMAELIGVGYHGTVALESVNKPQTSDENGPQGFSGTLTDITGSSTSICAYTDENVMAATWNVELMEKIGEHLGEDGLWGGYNGLYGPAMNTHRTAYAGRNFEYYSEDGFLGGKIAAAEVKGIQSKGVYVFIKHFALNDCETRCRSIATFTNEQAIREVYLEPFEHAVMEGGAYNVMNSFARIGVIWTGAHKGLMTDVLRGEWGCKGFGISDYTNTSYATTKHTRGTYDVLLGLMAGTDTFDSSDKKTQCNVLLTYPDPASDVHLINCMREATHRILYVVANSNAMNATGIVIKIMNWWQFVILDGIIDSCVLAVVFGVIAVVKGVKFKRAAAEGGDGGDGDGNGATGGNDGNGGNGGKKSKKQKPVKSEIAQTQAAEESVQKEERKEEQADLFDEGGRYYSVYAPRPAYASAGNAGNKYGPVAYAPYASRPATARPTSTAPARVVSSGNYVSAERTGAIASAVTSACEGTQPPYPPVYINIVNGDGKKTEGNIR